MFSRLALFGSTIGALVHLRWSQQRLPDRIATHFGASGQADGFSSPAGFLWTGLLLILTFALLAVVLSWLLRVLPASLINVPHREYWLTGERRDRSLGRLRVGLEWFGVLGVLFAVGINHSILRSNLTAASAESARIGGDFWWLLGAFVLATVVWIIWLLRGFPHPPERVEHRSDSGTVEPLEPA